MIIDASVLLSAFFPDESQSQAQEVLQAHVAGRERLRAPALIIYEVTNAVWHAERSGRITKAQADEILEVAAGLDIALSDMNWGEMLPMARKFNRSAYDAAYLTLAQSKAETFITGDKRLYNAVKSKLDWVLWMGDYQSV